ncbi:hypothetical protein IG631_04537 [Alternaria alternata]|nr:hypothetical protein IG631_04537 [Alternaria alternata]
MITASSLRGRPVTYETSSLRKCQCLTSRIHHLADRKTKQRYNLCLHLKQSDEAEHSLTALMISRCLLSVHYCQPVCGGAIMHVRDLSHSRVVLTPPTALTIRSMLKTRQVARSLQKPSTRCLDDIEMHADVWSSPNGPANQHWKSDFQKSRWFTRGWTLQELLCPIAVEFFSADWNMLGNKGSLSQQINLATGIPTEILLKKRSFLSYSVDDRMPWARGRQTKREEDIAYYLFGIFDIQLPVLYGEGEKKALIRLRKALHETMRYPLPPPPLPPPPPPPFFQHQLPPPPPPPPLQKLSDMRSYIETQSSFRVQPSKL